MSAKKPTRCSVAAGVKANRLVLGGRSYGGRMCSMAVAEGQPAAGLVLLSYPLHPPGKPENLRTEHFPDLRVPCLFVSGERDPFGSPAEFDEAVTNHSGAGHPGMAARRPRPPQSGRGHCGRGEGLARYSLAPAGFVSRPWSTGSAPVTGSGPPWYAPRRPPPCRSGSRECRGSPRSSGRDCFATP